MNEAQRFTLWSQFEGTFGVDGYLSYAVAGSSRTTACCAAALCLDPELSPIGALRKGLAAAAELDVDLVCAPDIAAEPDAIVAQQEVLDHCDRVGDRLAILDGVPTAEVAIVASASEPVSPA